LHTRVRIVRIIPVDDTFSNIDGQTERALAGADCGPPGRLFRFFQLPIGDRLLLKPRDLLVDYGFNIFIFLAWRDVCADSESAGAAPHAGEAISGNGELQFLDELLIEPRTLTAAEDCAEHLQRVYIGGGADVAFVSDIEQRELRELVVNGESTFGSLLRLGDVNPGWRRLRSNGLEMRFDPGERLISLEVADQSQDRVVRRVIDAEEFAHVLDARRIQVLHRAYDRMLVSEIVVHRFAELLEQFTVGLIVQPETALLLNGVTLVVEVLFRNVEAAHAVGFQIEHEVELIIGQLLEIKGALFTGRTVHLPAVSLYQNEMLTLADVLGALEHHVLE